MSDFEKDKEMTEEDVDQVTLTLDDGTEMICDILTIFPFNDKEYIALLPTDEKDDGDIFLYQFVEHNEDDIELIDIEDDDEFEAVSEAFDELMDTEEFNDMFEDDVEELETEADK